MLALAGAAVFAGCGTRRPPAADELDRLPIAAVAESARVSLVAGDWDRGQVLIGRLMRREPRNPMWLRASALAWHNVAWLGMPYDRSRTACRTSLERMALEQRALALVDSATACAQTDVDWSKARIRAAQVYEHVGLYVDAIGILREVEARDPGNDEARMRSAQIVAQLRSPSLPGRAAASLP